MKQESDNAVRIAREKAAATPSSVRIASTRLPLDRYVGTYSSDLLGALAITLADGKLKLARPQATAVLNHERNDMFKAQWDSPGQMSIIGQTPVGFTFAPDGEIATLELGGDKFARE